MALLQVEEAGGDGHGLVGGGRGGRGGVGFAAVAVEGCVDPAQLHIPKLEGLRHLALEELEGSPGVLDAAVPILASLQMTDAQNLD